MVNFIVKFSILSFCLLSFCIINLFPSEILVDPSVIVVKDIQIGREFEIHASTSDYFLNISNSGDKSVNYKVTIFSCKEYGCSPYFGYMDIPDIRWIEIKSPEISVPARETGYIRDVFIKIPKKRKYYSKKWQAIVKVVKLPNPGEGIQLEAVLPLWIETQKKPPTFFEKIFKK